MAIVTIPGTVMCVSCNQLFDVSVHCTIDDDRLNVSMTEYHSGWLVDDEFTCLECSTDARIEEMDI